MKEATSPDPHEPAQSPVSRDDPGEFPGGAACDLRFTISLFENERDTRPLRQDTTWEQLKARLSRFDLRDDKSGPGWSPVRYAEGAARGNVGVESISVAVMDVDDGSNPESVHLHLEGLGFEHVIHSTHSSTPEHPKFRVVVPLANPCSAASWPRVFPRLCVLLTEGRTDPGTKDPARLFFLPSVKPGGKTFTYSSHGRAILPADLPDFPASAARREPLTRADDRGPIPAGARHAKLVSIAGRLRHAGAGPEAILTELREVNVARCAPPLGEAELESIARSITHYEPGHVISEPSVGPDVRPTRNDLVSLSRRRRGER